MKTKDFLYISAAQDMGYKSFIMIALRHSNVMALYEIIDCGTHDWPDKSLFLFYLRILFNLQSKFKALV